LTGLEDTAWLKLRYDSYSLKSVTDCRRSLQAYSKTAIIKRDVIFITGFEDLNFASQR
jgi:hypothetical protein